MQQGRQLASIDAITSCNYSAHDLSNCRGEGDSNYARFTMPIEMGMALFHAIQSQLTLHRCAFFVSNRDYQIAASDLAGLDPKNYDSDESLLVASVYNWLRDVKAALNVEATPEILEKYQVFQRRLSHPPPRTRHSTRFRINPARSSQYPAAAAT